MTSIHQVIVGADTGDAITDMALRARTRLRAHGPSDVYAWHRAESMAGSVGTIDELPYGRPDDVIVYHMSFGIPPLTQVLLDRPERLVIVYHNITPSAYFLDDDPSFAAGLEWGRHELRLLLDRVDHAIADSRFNASELTELGYRDVVVAPLGLNPKRLLEVPPDLDMIELIAERMPVPFVIGVSQLLPHKRQHVLIQALHVLQHCHGIEIGLMLVGAFRSVRYTRALHDLVDRLRVRNVWFTDRLADRQLSAAMFEASAFASASEHEGLGIPPLEAMAFGVPAIVRDAGATADTVADGALVLPGDAGPLLYAGAIDRVLSDDRLRGRLITQGLDRVEQIVADAEDDPLGRLVVEAATPA